MTTLADSIAGNQSAVRDFVNAASTIPTAQWSQPAAPGKWTPGQVVEHICLAYEVGNGVLREQSALPVFPRWARPLIRSLFLSRILRTGRFPRGSKAPGPFTPSNAPPPPQTAVPRLQAAVAAFEANAAAMVNGGHTSFVHPVFGTMPVMDYIRLVEVHTQHHMKQLPSADHTD